MTDKNADLKADIPLAERRRIEAENQKAIREGIHNRHANLRTEECAVDRRT